ncbi:hypothetical protein CNEO2_460001 [Clostridium neonatale]|nr:hypothetical protein CNEO2_460001 [Clostridium neonatale]CAI3605929.1 hypothetical protein CNEO4_480001 [Clostridium neonatale]
MHINNQQTFHFITSTNYNLFLENYSPYANIILFDFSDINLLRHFLELRNKNTAYSFECKRQRNNAYKINIGFC